MPKDKIVVVEWTDAWHGTFAQYQTYEDAKNNKPLVLQDVGFLVCRTKEGITIATCGPKNEDETNGYRHLQFIPKGMIKSVRELK